MSRLAVGAAAAVLALAGTVCAPAARADPPARADTMGGAGEFVAQVHDDEGDLSLADFQRIRRAATSLRRAHDIVVGVQTVAGFGSESPQAFARARARSLHLGEAGEDNGVLIVVSRARGQVRIVADDGAQAQVSDSEIHEVEAAMTPLVRRGEVTDAILTGIRELRREAEKSQSSPQPEPIAFGVAVVAVAGGVVALAGKLLLRRYGRRRAARPARERV